MLITSRKLDFRLPKKTKAVVSKGDALRSVFSEIHYKVFIQASGLACEVYVAVSLLRSLPTIVCEVADSVVCQVAMLPFFNSL